MTFVLALLVFLCGRLSPMAQASCSIKCGVVETRRGESTLLGFVQRVWSDIQHTKGLRDITITFENLERLTDMDWDTYLRVYMDMGSKNVSSVIGPYIQPIAASSERYGIPYFVMDTSARLQYTPYNLVRVFPDLSEIYRIAVDVTKQYNMNEVVMFYEGSYGVQLLEELVQWPTVRVRAYKLNDSVFDDDMRNILLSVRHLMVTNFIVIASRILTNRIMEKALHLSMLSNRYTWILPTLDQDVTDLNPYAYTEVNLTTFHLTQGDLSSLHGSLRPFTEFEYVTVYDALLTLYEGVKLHSRSFSDCLWAGKEFLLPTLRQIDINGATGQLSYREDGSRQGYVVNILGFQSEKLKTIGLWNSSKEVGNRLQLHLTDVSDQQSLEYPLGKEIVKVVTMLEDPFVMLVSDHKKKEGNAKYEGYCVDLMKYIAAELGIEYELYISPDKQFGSPTENGTWNGMVQQLLTGNASLAVASLTITAQREEVIDFSKPFRPRGLSLVMKKTEAQTSFFQLLDPLSPMVWCLILAVLVIISLILYIVDRLAPMSNIKEYRFTISQCIWYTFASLLRKGLDYEPRSVPGKIMAGFLWFFSLIIVSTYTANLAAFLTISKFVTPIQSVFDLENQGKVHYGTVWNSATSDFFKHNKLEYFQRVWQYMAYIDTSGMVDSHVDGFDMVKQSDGDYAFIWDADVIRHEVNKDCDLVEVGQVFDNAKGYGVATPRGARYRDDISMAILRLNENGALLQLDQKWWEPPTCPNSMKQKSTGPRQALSVDQISGVFVVLMAGTFIALFAAFITYLVNRKQRKHKTRKETTDIVNEFAKEERNNCHVFKEKKTYDVNLMPMNAAEEPFLSNVTVNPPGCSKQTNIF